MAAAASALDKHVPQQVGQMFVGHDADRRPLQLHKSDRSKG